MRKTILSRWLALLGIVLGMVPSQAGIVIDFEELTVFTGTSGATDGQPGGQFYNGNNGTGNNYAGWSSQGVEFENTYEKIFFNGFEYESWTGWAYSNVRNNISPGFFNQYAAYPEGGAGSRNNYAIGFTGSDPSNNGTVLTLPQATSLQSIDISNTTYALRWLRDGLDGFSPDPLPGAAFGNGDFLRLTITGFDGLDGTGNSTGSVTVTLADYGGSGTQDDFRLESWLTTDLSSFAPSRSLAFSLASSQVGAFGIDTPVYFAADNLRLSAVPEPSGLALVACALGWSFTRRSRRSARTS